MAKIFKATKARETLCKEYHTRFNSMGMPAKLEPNLYLIVDTDELQKQVNRLENRVKRIQRVHSKDVWTRSNHTRRKKCQ